MPQGYIVGKEKVDRKSEVYYKNALDKELKAFIQAFFSAVYKSYDTIQTSNAYEMKTLPQTVSSVRKVVEAFKGKFLSQFLLKSDKIVSKWLDLTDKSVKKSIYEALSVAPSNIADIRSQKYREALKMIVNRNTQLIKNATTQTITNIENIVYDSVLNNQPVEQLANDLNQQLRIARNKAKLIATDQTNKAKRSLSQMAQQENGVKFFLWRTKEDDRVSTGYGGHKQLNGKIYAWNEPENYPIIDSYGHKGLPSQRVNCYHKDTEVLTKNDGFKPIKDVKVGEMIATINPETKIWEWKECINTFKEKVENIYDFSNHYFRLRVSDNHTFFYYKRKFNEKGKQLVCGTEYPCFSQGIKSLAKNNTFFIATSNWVGENTDNYKGIPIDIFCKFMGYYLSDGNVDKRTNNAIHIANTDNQAMFDELKPYFHICQGKEKLFIYNKDLFDLVAPLGYCNEKYIPEVIKNLPPEKIRIFLDAYASCDGMPEQERIGFKGTEKEVIVKRHNQYYTTSHKMAADLIECIYKSGSSASLGISNIKGKDVKFKNGVYTTNYDVYRISEIKSKYRSIIKGYKEEKYNDYVYDIEVKDNHTILIKDKQSIHFNSNCRCVASPVWVLDGWTAEKQSDGSYKIVRNLTRKNL